MKGTVAAMCSSLKDTGFTEPVRTVASSRRTSISTPDPDRGKPREPTSVSRRGVQGGSSAPGPWEFGPKAADIDDSEHFNLQEDQAPTNLHSRMINFFRSAPKTSNRLWRSLFKAKPHVLHVSQCIFVLATHYLIGTWKLEICEEAL